MIKSLQIMVLTMGLLLAGSIAQAATFDVYEWKAGTSGCTLYLHIDGDREAGAEIEGTHSAYSMNGNRLDIGRNYKTISGELDSENHSSITWKSKRGGNGKAAITFNGDKTITWIITSVESKGEFLLPHNATFQWRGTEEKTLR